MNSSQTVYLMDFPTIDPAFEFEIIFWKLLGVWSHIYIYIYIYFCLQRSKRKERICQGDSRATLLSPRTHPAHEVHCPPRHSIARALNFTVGKTGGVKAVWSCMRRWLLQGATQMNLGFQKISKSVHAVGRKTLVSTLPSSLGWSNNQIKTWDRVTREKDQI